VLVFILIAALYLVGRKKNAAAARAPAASIA